MKILVILCLLSTQQTALSGNLTKATRQLINSQKLVDSRKIKNAITKAVGDGELGDLKNLLKRGDTLSDAASLAYYRTFKDAQDQFLKNVNQRLSKIAKVKAGELDEELPTVSLRVDLVTNDILVIRHFIREFLSSLKVRNSQITDLVHSNKKLKTIYGLCCRKTSAPNPLTTKSLSDIFLDEHNSVDEVVTRISRMRNHTYHFYPHFFEEKTYIDNRFKSTIMEIDKANSNLKEGLEIYRILVLDAIKASGKP